MEELIARRQFAPLYIWLDIAFLCVFLALLLWKHRCTRGTNEIK